MNTKMYAIFSSGLTLFKVIFLPLVVAVLLLSACSSEPDQQLPEGVYTMTLTLEDWDKLGLPAEDACENVGTFALTVTGSTWSVFQTAAPGCEVYNPSWSGSWKFSGDRVKITEEIQGNCRTCTYQWAYDGAELRFTRVKDLCQYRIARMTTHPWVLQK